MKHDARFGYTYMPGVKLRVPTVNGGYLVRSNSAGFRSEHEFAERKDPQRFRILLYGDSQTAGDGLSNKQRYSDLIENEIPRLEIYNYGLSGSSVDQHYLIYKEVAGIEHDLIVIAFYVENILRVRRRVVRAQDSAGNEVFRAKPYFENDDSGLTLRNVPVRKQSWTAESLPADLIPHVYGYGEANVFFRRLSKRHEFILGLLAPFGSVRRAAKRMLAKLRRFHPLSSYDEPTNTDWLVLRGIFKKWTEESRTPILVVLLPLESAIDGLSDPGNYQRRFRELSEETGCHVHDLLPDLLNLPYEERVQLWSYSSGHLSAFGHQVIARLMTPLVERFMSARALI